MYSFPLWQTPERQSCPLDDPVEYLLRTSFTLQAVYMRALFSPTEINDTALQNKGKPLGTCGQASSLSLLTCLMTGPVIRPNMSSLLPDGLMI